MINTSLKPFISINEGYIIHENNQLNELQNGGLKSVKVVGIYMYYTYYVYTFVQTLFNVT